MSFADRYLSKQKDFSPRIKNPPREDLNYIVVVPCYREPQIIHAANSLRKAAIPSISVDIIVVINSSESDTKETIHFNSSTKKELEEWSKINSNENFRLYIINETNIPKKFAGVGFARKLGMDEAIFRFNLLKRESGVIISFDADSKCDKNFFSSIDLHYRNYPKTNGSTVYFEHPVEGTEFNPQIYTAISKYELHLRYFVQSMRYIEFPYAFHTVGSCFNVSARAYVKQGGMNKRQGGEDFYFLHKIMPLGQFYEINSTRVIPSPRASNRVPFGTGPAISKIIESENINFDTYQFEAFQEIKYFLEQLPVIYKTLHNKTEFEVDKFPLGIRLFLQKENVHEHFAEAYNNSSSMASFKKRLLNWFDAFKLIKCLNYLHEEIYAKNEIETEAKKLLNRKGLETGNKKLDELLIIYRKLDRGLVN